MNQLSELFLSQSLRLVQSQRCSLKLSRPLLSTHNLTHNRVSLKHSPRSVALKIAHHQPSLFSQARSLKPSISVRFHLAFLSTALESHKKTKAEVKGSSPPAVKTVVTAQTSLFRLSIRYVSIFGFRVLLKVLAANFFVSPTNSLCFSSD